MQTLEQIAREQSFYDEISDHWQQRAKKLQNRRWRAIIAKDRDSRLLSDIKEVQKKRRFNHESH